MDTNNSTNPPSTVISNGELVTTVNDSISTPQKKRENYLHWQDYFMATACLTAQRSKDPICQVGACIVNKDNVIVGLGYNGLPRGCHDDVFPWGKNTESSLDSKHSYVCHAEMNAIVNKNTRDINDCTIYVTRIPCHECAKLIIQVGIKEVLYLSGEGRPESILASKRMFNAAKVDCRQYEPTRNVIVIDFPAIERHKMSSDLANLTL